MVSRIQRLYEGLKLVGIKLAASFQKQSRHYNLRHRQWQPQIGENEQRRSHLLSKKSSSLTAKLAEKYERPFVVIKNVPPVIFDVRNARGKTYRHIHVKELKPYVEEKIEENGRN